MYIRKNTASLLIVLSLILGCNMVPQEPVISMAITCSDNSVDSFRATCFISDASGNRIDTKTFEIKRDNKEFWTRYSFKVTKSTQVVLDVVSAGSSNRLYRAISNKITIAKGGKQNIYLSLEKTKTAMERYSDTTVRVSGNVNCSDYRGPIEIQIATQADQKKIKYAGDFPPITAKTIINYTGESVDFSLDVPINLGPSIICFFRTGNTEPPFCQDIDVSSTDIQGINFQR